MATLINLKSLCEEERLKLFHFFQSQSEAGEKGWHKDRIYTFEDGSEFIFKNDVIQRERKEGRSGVRYEVISNKPSIGKGMFGEIKGIKGTVALSEETMIFFKKRQKDGSQRVVKIQKSDTKEDLDRSLNEYQAAKRADHLHVKKPTFWNHPPQSYTVMKRLPGVELFDIIYNDLSQHQPLSLSQRVQLTKALLQALLDQVMKKDLIHLDLKPENILVSFMPSLTVNIIDFGLSINRDGAHPIRGWGTPGYICPEMLIESWRHMVSSKSDVYSMARIIALIWHADLSTYSSYRSYTSKMNKPSELLQNLFSDMSDIESYPEQKKLIETTLIKMLSYYPNLRLSANEAMDCFSALRIDEEPSIVPSDIVPIPSSSAA